MSQDHLITSLLLTAVKHRMPFQNKISLAQEQLEKHLKNKCFFYIFIYLFHYCYFFLIIFLEEKCQLVMEHHKQFPIKNFVKSYSNSFIGTCLYHSAQQVERPNVVVCPYRVGCSLPPRPYLNVLPCGLDGTAVYQEVSWKYVLPLLSLVWQLCELNGQQQVRSPQIMQYRCKHLYINKATPI